MKFKGKYRIESIRLKGYDYSQPGAYFVTICTHQRENLFGEIVDGQMQLNPWGQIVHDAWFKTSGMYSNIKLLSRKQRRNMILPKWVGRFKMVSAKQINQIRQTPGISVWQRNYYEHIIRTYAELRRIRTYIVNNPINWDKD